MKKHSLIVSLIIALAGAIAPAQDVSRVEPVITNVPAVALNGDLVGKAFGSTKGTIYVVCTFNNNIVTDKAGVPDNAISTWTNDRVKIAWPNIKSFNDFMTDLKMTNRIEEGVSLKGCKYQIMRSDNIKTTWK